MRLEPINVTTTRTGNLRVSVPEAPHGKARGAAETRALLAIERERLSIIEHCQKFGKMVRGKFSIPARSRNTFILTVSNLARSYFISGLPEVE